ncbi:hypothetical protein [Streptomyces sp. M54]|uniref:hypothetical protein n=1 Tax=Streptomyces sp. M54 TaxID=2759525 RepID=UPI00353016EC
MHNSAVAMTLAISVFGSGFARLTRRRTAPSPGGASRVRRPPGASRNDAGGR